MLNAFLKVGKQPDSLDTLCGFHLKWVCVRSVNVSKQSYPLGVTGGLPWSICFFNCVSHRVGWHEKQTCVMPRGRLKGADSLLLITSEAIYHVELFPPSAVLQLPTLPAPWSSTSTSCSAHCLFPPRALRLPPSTLEPWHRLWGPAAATAHLEKEKHFIYHLLYSYKCNKHRMSLRYLNEQLVHVTMDFLSFVAFSFPLAIHVINPLTLLVLKQTVNSQSRDCLILRAQDLLQWSLYPACRLSALL